MSMGLVPAPSPSQVIAQTPTQSSCPRGSMDTEESRYHKLVRVEVLLVILACSLLFLGVFGAFRRCCINRKLALLGLVAYSISATTVAYTLGLIQNATFRSELFPLGAIFLVVVLGSADSYVVHSLDDVERWRSFNIDWAGKSSIIWVVISTYKPASKLMRIPEYLVLLVFFKVDNRIRALFSISRDAMQKNFIALADYMKTEHRGSNSDEVDPSSLRGYKYCVSVAKETKFSLAFCREKPRWIEAAALRVPDDVITVEKVWNCKGRLLSAAGGDPDGQLKDLCLSFSLFNLVCLRFAGYSLPREAHDKLWSLIQHLLSGETGYERVFRVIEVELALLFDLFYTNFSVTPSAHRIVFEILQLVALLAFSLSMVSSFHDYQTESKWATHDVTVILFMMITVLGVEIVQFGIRIFSEWAKMLYICLYVRNEWCQENKIMETLIKIMCKVELRKPWGRQLRQYSLLEKYSYSPWKLIYNSITAGYYDQKRDGEQEIASTRLSKEVIKAIAQSLMNNGTRYLENGRASLRRNNVFDQLSWACDLESTNHVIMVWHIATSICEHEQQRGQRENFNIAIVLSNYLAYLVAYAPRLLPDHPYRSEYIFNDVVKEAREIFGGSSISMDERIQKLEVLDDEKYGGKIVGQGMRLRRQLLIEATDEEHIWMILADFWAEMMLYVAPSNDTQAHAKYLATGGEFVSHVWVLLSHAGIMRSPRGGEQHDDPERY